MNVVATLLLLVMLAGCDHDVDRQGSCTSQSEQCMTEEDQKEEEKEEEEEEDAELETSPYMDPSLVGLDQSDPRLAEAIRNRFLVFPPKQRRPPKLVKPLTANLLRAQFGQPMEVDELYRWVSCNRGSLRAFCLVHSSHLLGIIGKNVTDSLLRQEPTTGRIFPTRSSSK